MKDEEWIVTLYEFNDHDMQYQFKVTRRFDTNNALLTFIKSMALNTTEYRYTITFVIKGKGA